MAGVCSSHLYIDPTCKHCTYGAKDRYGRTRDSYIDEALEDEKKSKRRMTMIVTASAEPNKCSFHGKNRNPYCPQCRE